MKFEEKTLKCADCGADFAFTAEEQEFFASKGFTNEPRRCKPCRQVRKGETGGRGGGTRQTFAATCAQCGKETQVPFEPRSGRPVYCSECYTKVRAGR